MNSESSSRYIVELNHDNINDKPNLKRMDTDVAVLWDIAVCCVGGFNHRSVNAVTTYAYRRGPGKLDIRTKNNHDFLQDLVIAGQELNVSTEGAADHQCVCCRSQ